MTWRMRMRWLGKNLAVLARNVAQVGSFSFGRTWANASREWSSTVTWMYFMPGLADRVWPRLWSVVSGPSRRQRPLSGVGGGFFSSVVGRGPGGWGSLWVGGGGVEFFHMDVEWGVGLLVFIAQLCAAGCTDPDACHGIEFVQRRQSGAGDDPRRCRRAEPHTMPPPRPRMRAGAKGPI